LFSTKVAWIFFSHLLIIRLLDEILNTFLATWHSAKYESQRQLLEQYRLREFFHTLKTPELRHDISLDCYLAKPTKHIIPVTLANIY